jgi:hypothetical protein
MSDFFTAHKPIRDKIRKYNPTSIIRFALSYLKNIDKISIVNALNFSTPWTNLLLIRWTYQYTENRLKDIDERNFQDLLGKISILRDHHDGYEVSKIIDPSLFLDQFLRRTAHQQILSYQINNNTVIRHMYARQMMLFDTSELNDIFKSLSKKVF